jgi:hypothetical protein
VYFGAVGLERAARFPQRQDKPADLGLAYGLLPAGLAGLAAPGQPSQGGVGEAGVGCCCRLAYHRER